MNVTAWSSSMFKFIALAAGMVLAAAIMASSGLLRPEQFGEVVCFASCLVGSAHVNGGKKE
jgi:hypothetical protein